METEIPMNPRKHFELILLITVHYYLFCRLTLELSGNAEADARACRLLAFAQHSPF
jgi:hypothetical protein